MSPYTTVLRHIRAGDSSSARVTLPRMSTYLACCAAILTATVLSMAIRHSLAWWESGRTCCARFAHGDGTHDVDCPDVGPSLRDEQSFVDGWRACEQCRRLPPSIDDEHILHHYTWDGHSNATCGGPRSTK